MVLIPRKPNQSTSVRGRVDFERVWALPHTDVAAGDRRVGSHPSAFFVNCGNQEAQCRTVVMIYRCHRYVGHDSGTDTTSSPSSSSTPFRLSRARPVGKLGPARPTQRSPTFLSPSSRA